MRGLVRQVGHVGAGSLCLIGSVGCDVSAAWPQDDPLPESTTRPCRSTRSAPVALDDSEGLGAIAVEETDTTVEVVAASVQGRGSDFVGNVSLTEGVGRLSLGCESVPAAIYERRSGMTREWFYGVAVQPDRLYLFTLLCSEGELRELYYEGTDGTPSSYEPASGSCTELTTAVAARVQFPATSVLLPRLATGFSIESEDLSLSKRGTGTLVLEGIEHQLAAFNSDGCGNDCADREWHELSALIWRPEESGLRLARLELNEADVPIELDSSLSLPSFGSELTGLQFDAAFTTP